MFSLCSHWDFVMACLYLWSEYVKICDLKHSIMESNVVTSLTKNRIHTVDSWSKLEEIVRYLNAMDMDHKKYVIQKQISVMSPKPVGTEIYGPE